MEKLKLTYREVFERTKEKQDNNDLIRSKSITQEDINNNNVLMVKGSMIGRGRVVVACSIPKAFKAKDLINKVISKNNNKISTSQKETLLKYKSIGFKQAKEPLPTNYLKPQYKLKIQEYYFNSLLSFIIDTSLYSMNITYDKISEYGEFEANFVKYNYLNAQKDNRIYWTMKANALDKELENTHTPFFTTLTLGAKYHPYSYKSEKPNTRYNQKTIKEGIEILKNHNRTMYNNFTIKVNGKTKKINVKFIKVVEFHKDFAPHQHTIYYVPNKYKDLFQKHWINTCKKHKVGKRSYIGEGLEESFKEIKEVEHKTNKTRQTSKQAIAYLLKYVGKTFNLDMDKIDISQSKTQEEYIEKLYTFIEDLETNHKDNITLAFSGAMKKYKIVNYMSKINNTLTRQEYKRITPHFDFDKNIDYEDWGCKRSDNILTIISDFTISNRTIYSNVKEVKTTIKEHTTFNPHFYIDTIVLNKTKKEEIDLNYKHNVRKAKYKSEIMRDLEEYPNTRNYKDILIKQNLEEQEQELEYEFEEENIIKENRTNNRIISQQLYKIVDSFDFGKKDYWSNNLLYTIENNEIKNYNYLYTNKMPKGININIFMANKIYDKYNIKTKKETNNLQNMNTNIKFEELEDKFYKDLKEKETRKLQPINYYID